MSEKQKPKRTANDVLNSVNEDIATCRQLARVYGDSMLIDVALLNLFNAASALQDLVDEVES